MVYKIGDTIELGDAHQKFKIIEEQTHHGEECWIIQPFDKDGNLVYGLFSKGLVEKKDVERERIRLEGDAVIDMEMERKTYSEIVVDCPLVKTRVRIDECKRCRFHIRRVMDKVICDTPSITPLERLK